MRRRVLAGEADGEEDAEQQSDEPAAAREPAIDGVDALEREYEVLEAGAGQVGLATRGQVCCHF